MSGPFGCSKWPEYQKKPAPVRVIEQIIRYHMPVTAPDMVPPIMVAANKKIMPIVELGPLNSKKVPVTKRINNTQPILNERGIL